ncbi:MAG: hypothetical protein WA840_24050 [Caulobacteraceae bacterium]
MPNTTPDPAGFTAETWNTVTTFTGRVATQADVEAGRAVFALAETYDAQAFDEPLPQPVIWTDEEADEEFAALIIQAEQHETEEGEQLQVLGLLLPQGRTVVAFTEDVEEVDAANTDWLALLEADLAVDEEDGE